MLGIFIGIYLVPTFVMLYRIWSANDMTLSHFLLAFAWPYGVVLMLIHRK